MRNVVCTIKPPGYELESLLRLLRSYREKDTKGYVIESVWKFLLFSELAKATADHIRQQRAVIMPGSPEADLIETIDSAGEILTGDFAIRLERAVEELLPVDVGTGVAVGRLAISEALHDTLLRDLRKVLRGALSGRHRVAILVDNLEGLGTRRGHSRVNAVPAGSPGRHETTGRRLGVARAVGATSQVVIGCLPA